MALVAVIGEEFAVQGFGLAGVLVLPATGTTQVCTAWQHLPADVDLVILTGPAACALGEQAYVAGAPLTVVMDR